MEKFFREMIESGTRDQTIPPSVPPDETAKALLGLFLGLRVLARSYANDITKQAIIDQAKRMLD